MSVADTRISGSLGTLEFLPSETGTDLIFTHQAASFEGADGPAMREAGWRKLFDQLTAEFPTPDLRPQRRQPIGQKTADISTASFRRPGIARYLGLAPSAPSRGIC